MTQFYLSGKMMVQSMLARGIKCITHKPVELDAVLKKHRKDVEARLASYVVQPKYDGCHMIAIVEGKSAELVSLFSRTGEEVKSLEHIRHALGTFPSVADGVYIGEVWDEGTPFDDINGAFRKKSEQASHLQFVIFDYLTLEEYEAGRSDVGYAQRVLRMPDMMHRIVDPKSDVPMAGKEKAGKQPIRLAWSEGVAGNLAGTAIDWANAYKADPDGYDGVILRDPYGTWTMGLGKGGEIIKVKPRPDYDLEVIRIETVKGEKTGRDVYKVVVRLPNGQEQTVGSGVPHDFLSGGYPDAREWPGQIVQISCMGLTKNGLMREPVFERIREDKK